MAEFFRRSNIEYDEVSQFLYQYLEDSFIKAMALSSLPYKPISIAYGGTMLPGYFISIDNIKKPYYIMIFNSGYDLIMNKAWFAIGAAAIVRGYNFLTFDSPGQGAAIRRQHLYFRPN